MTAENTAIRATARIAGSRTGRCVDVPNPFVAESHQVQLERSFRCGGSPVTEGTAANFTVTANRAPATDLTVNLTVSEASGSDFVAAADEGAKTVTIAAAATAATYSVTTQADSADEPIGSVTVTVVAGTGYIPGRPVPPA